MESVAIDGEGIWIDLTMDLGGSDGVETCTTAI